MPEWAVEFLTSEYGIPVTLVVTAFVLVGVSRVAILFIRPFFGPAPRTGNMPENKSRK
ncbi:MAG: hypothetical protein PHW75_00975 [Patescibacteria group bacterium]|nr:hypothetical protein [Patescibacteria group bacterium]